MHLNKKLLEAFQPNFFLGITFAQAYFDLYISVLNKCIRKPKSFTINSFVEAKFFPKYYLSRQFHSKYLGYQPKT